MSFGPFSGLYFMFYEYFKKTWTKPNEDISFLKSLTLAGAAGALAGTLTNPLDIAKLRMQVQRAERAAGVSASAEGRFGYKNIFHGIYRIVSQEGALSLFKGKPSHLLFFILPQYRLFNQDSLSCSCNSYKHGMSRDL